MIPTSIVDVEMADLDTGIDKRNRDMRENHLETDLYPTARFEGANPIGRRCALSASTGSGH